MHDVNECVVALIRKFNVFFPNIWIENIFLNNYKISINYQILIEINIVLLSYLRIWKGIELKNIVTKNYKVHFYRGKLFSSFKQKVHCTFSRNDCRVKQSARVAITMFSDKKKAVRKLCYY